MMNSKNNYLINPKARIFVREIMTMNLITVKEDTCIQMIAQLMNENRIGSVIVTGKQGYPLGIITEKDLVWRILTKITNKRLVKRILEEDAKITRITAADVMTSPLVTISHNKDLIDAVRKMRKHKIRRLGVMARNQLTGIISSKDILSVIPELIEILHEKKKIEEINQSDFSENSISGSYCGECGNWFYNLDANCGKILCEECTPI